MSDLPELGLIPASQGLPQAQRDGLNALSLAFNAQLSTRLDQLQMSLGITIDRLDLNGVLLAAQANPAAFGFTNVTQASLDNGDTSGTGYLFWDDLHPTTAGQILIADAAFMRGPGTAKCRPSGHGGRGPPHRPLPSSCRGAVARRVSSN